MYNIILYGRFTEDINGSKWKKAEKILKMKI